MAFFKIEFELEWLGLVSICAFLIYIIYRKQNRLLKLSKANRLPDPPKLSCDQKCVRDECVKIADYFQRFHVKLNDAFHSFRNTDVADIQLLSNLRDHCAKMFSDLVVDSDSNRDVIKFVGDFVADFQNSRLFNLISDKDAEIDCQKVELLLSIEYLKKVCGNVASLCTDVSNKPPTWFKDENVKKMMSRKFSEASRWLYGWRVAPFFNADMFNISEVGKYLKARIEQLSDEK